MAGPEFHDLKTGRIAMSAVPVLPDLAEAPDVVKRRAVPIKDIAKEDDKLLHVYRYWDAKRKSGLLPARRDIDIVELRPVVGTTHIIDVASKDPGKYKFRLYGTGVRQVEQKLPSQFLLESLKSRAYRDALKEDYSAVVFSGSPAYHQVVAMLDYVTYSYSRLILPLAEDGREVNMLMVCINARKFNDFKL